MRLRLGFRNAVIAVGLSLFAVPAACNGYYVYGTGRAVTVTVEEKERIQDGESSKYLIFTDKGVFENTDTLLRWKFNSSDVYSALKVGKEYDVDVYGWRVPFFSVYPNIVSVTER